MIWSSWPAWASSSLTAGGADTESGLHLFAEATLTLDEDGDIETDNDRQFSFTDLVSGDLFDALLFDFTGYGEARLDGLDVSPNIPLLNEDCLNDGGALDHHPESAPVG